MLDGIAPEALRPFLDRLQRRRYQPGDVLLRQGDPPAEMFLLEQGTVEVLLAARGREHVLAELGAPSSVGEMSLFTGAPVSATVRVAGAAAVDVLVLQAVDLAELGQVFPVVHRNLGQLLAARLARSNARGAPEAVGEVVCLRDLGGPPLLAEALAASIAWHTRGSTVLAGGAEALERLRLRHDHVLVRLPADAPPHPDATEVRLLAVGDSAGSGPGARGWTAPRIRQDRAGEVVDVPRPSVAEEAAIAAGRLPATGPAGRALGVLARRLVGLRIGVALGAGGARGYAHVGVIRVLQRLGVPVDAIAGTSVGAMAAPLYALDVPALDIAGLLDRGSSSLRLRPSPWSLVTSVGLQRFLERWFGPLRLEDLPVPVGLVATDVERGCEVVLDRGLVWPAMLASSALPGVLRAQRVGGRTLVDGGVLNPVPGDVASRLGADVVIAVRVGTPQAGSVSAAAAGASPSDLSMLRIALTSIDLMQAHMQSHTSGAATIRIEPDFPAGGGVAMHHFPHGRRFIEVGEAAAEAARPQLGAALPFLRP